MKQALYQIVAIVLSITAFQHQGLRAQATALQEESSYVVIEISTSGFADDEARANYIHALIEHINALNNDRGIVTKISHLRFDTQRSTPSIVSIRPFTTFKSAQEYADFLFENMDHEKFSAADPPFPITTTNYRACLQQKGFKDYIEHYNTRD